MSKSGHEAGVPPGTRGGAKAGDFAGQKTDVTVGKQTLNGTGGTIEVGTISADIVTVPLSGLEYDIPVVKGRDGATFPVNARLDGNDLMSTTEDVTPPGATLSVDPDQNRQAADKPTHTLTAVVEEPIAATGGTVEVTPTFKGLSE